MEGDPAQLTSRRRAAAAAVVLVAIGVVAALLWPKHNERTGSLVVPHATVHIGSPPALYRVTYRDTVGTGSDATSSTTNVIVRRPFEAQTVTTSSSHVTNADAWSFGRHETNDQVQFWAPGPVPVDSRPDVVLADAVRKRFARPREVRRIAGRLCRVYRVATPSNAQPLRTVRADAKSYRDVCVDADGLMLEEATFDDTHLVRRRLATTVVIEPPIDPGVFTTDGNELEPEQTGSFQRLAPESRLPGERFFELRHAPKGFVKRGRFAVVPPGQPGLSDARSRSQVVAFVSEVWTRGIDVLVIDQGGPSAGRAFVPDRDAKTAHAGALGTGELRYGLDEDEVRFAVGGSRFVKIHGTLPMQQLIDVARSMRRVAGGPLVTAAPAR